MTRRTGSEPAPDFGPLITARFVERPNRFLVVCDVPEKGRLRAFMPNPGRMWELLLPDAELLLAECPTVQPGRKTRFTVVAVMRDGAPVFLHTSANNAVARALIEARSIPGLGDARVVRSEVTVGRSRFDFLLEEQEHPLYLEVKSCTLFGNGVAMFPDAVTERGRRHLEELARLADEGRRAAVLFLVHTPRVDWFMPDVHTDPAFAETLVAVRDRIWILPVSLDWTRRLTLRGAPQLLRIPWDHIEARLVDRGAYLLVLRLPRGRVLDVGSLGRTSFLPGYYVYAGSAMRNLAARMARHTRLRKTKRWHIDFLRAAATECLALPIRTPHRIEVPLAEALGALFEPGPAGFGASDSPLDTHLYHSPTHPLDLPSFHAVLERFRMERPK